MLGQPKYFILNQQYDFQDQELKLNLTSQKYTLHSNEILPTYIYNMINTNLNEVMGSISLTVSDKYNEDLLHWGNIGYHVNIPFRGHNYAARSTKLLLNFVRLHQVEEIFAVTNPENSASRKSLEKAGFKLIEQIEVPKNHYLYSIGDRWTCRYCFNF